MFRLSQLVPHGCAIVGMVTCCLQIGLHAAGPQAVSSQLPSAAGLPWNGDLLPSDRPARSRSPGGRSVTQVA